jgi:hypothetical protein
MTKKYLTITFVVSAGIVFGVFLLGNSNKTFYIKNSSPYLANLHSDSDFKLIADDVGDLSNTIIPSIKVPENLTENFAADLARQIISLNDEPKAGSLLPGPGLNVPDFNKLAEDFIDNGLKQANKNILDIALPQLRISTDNGKEATEKYLAAIQKIINDNLKTGDSLIDLLEDINKNNGQGVEKLLPIIAAHEAAANQIEAISVPSGLKNLMTEEIRLLRITANVLKAIINVETDPLGTIAATGQFDSVIRGWIDLQEKFNSFIKKLNQAR